MLISLEYHDIVPNEQPDASGFVGAAAASYKLSEETFRTHLSTLSALSVPVVTLRDQPSIPGAGIVLTFDDGGRSAAHAIAPLLEAFGWRGHFFIASDCLDTHGFVSSHDLRGLVQAGHVVGSHSRTHPLRMASLATAALRSEWRESKMRLEDIAGVELPVASVPGGALSRRVIETAAESGIRVLFTSEPETDSVRRAGCAVLGRYTLRAHHTAATVAALTGRSPLARSQQWLVWNAKKVLKRFGGAQYLALRERLFR